MPHNFKSPGQKGAEYTAPATYDPARPLPYIEVTNPQNSLPDLDYSWTWAHVQIITDRTLSTKEEVVAELDNLLGREPERIISRLMCPRRLDPGVLYHAFMVPAFESGRLAGLGGDGAGATLLQSAWTLNNNPVELPYYYKWEFRTGLRGDFEYLIRLLQPRVLDKRVGMRFMDCSKPGFGIPSVNVPAPAEDKPPDALGLEGALKTLDTVSTKWPGTTTDGVQEKFGDLLDLPADQIRTQPASPPLIVPPIYGCWHRAKNRVEKAGYEQNWLDTLNLDPRHRATANFGTRVVQDQQEKLMAAAWKQVGDVEEANELLRQAQLGRAALERMHNKHLKNLSLGRLIRLTTPVNSRILIETGTAAGGPEKVTVNHHITESPIPFAAVDPAFRRIQRPRGPVRRRQQPDSDPNRRDLLERLNDGEVAAAGPAPDPTPGLGDISDGLRPGWARGWLWKILKHLPKILLILVFLITLVLLILQQQGMGLPPGHPLVIAAQALLLLAAYLIKRFTAQGLLSENLREEKLTSGLVDSARPPDDFAGQTGVAPGEFKQIAGPVQDFLNYLPQAKAKPAPIDLAKVRDTVFVGLDPRKTVPMRIKNRLVLNLRELPRRKDELQSIMAAPEFDQPMYEPLRDLSQDLLLPGLEYIPQNTIGLLENNQKFIEAYMVGLNHEMARELLWREYPTDQRGSYFRQFWDVRDVVPEQSVIDELTGKAREQAGDAWATLTEEEKGERVEKLLKERLKDIDLIHTWRGNKLGRNSGRDELSAPAEEKLVLLIRGDLLKKYPNTVVYAARGEWQTIGDNKARRPIFDHTDENTETPIFKGTLPPDITFLGFNLTESVAKGSTKPEDNDPGWFFVIEERVSETRFGMDTTRSDGFESWDDLSWEHIDHLPVSGHLDNVGLNGPPDDNEGYDWGQHAASMAYITMQKPMRIALHADDMIPEHQTAAP